MSNRLGGGIEVLVFHPAMIASSGARPRRKLATAAVLFGMFAGAIEMTIVGTAMPRIVGALGGSDRFAWVISVYLLTNTVAAPLSGKLADLYGRRPVYLTGMALFLLGSTLSGAAPSMTVLIVGRAIQGVGGGTLATVGLTIVGDLYTPVERGRIQGLFSAVWGTAGAIGPVAGGYIVDHFSWRWVFYLNLPFGLIAMALVTLALRENVQSRDVALDVWGALALTAAIAVLQFAGGGHGSPVSARSGLLGLLGALLIAAFVFIERRVEAPLLPMTIFRERRISSALAASLLSGSVMFGITNFVPMYLQAVTGSSARTAGSALIPFSLGWPIAGMIAGLLIARVDSRTLIRTGMLLVVTGASVIVVAGQGFVRGPYALAGLFIGCGMGLSSTPMLIALQSSVSWDQRGVITAAFSLCRTVGGSLGIIGASFAQNARLNGRGIPAATVDAMLRPGAPLGPFAVRSVLADAMRGAFLVTATAAALACIAAFAFPSSPVHRRVPGTAEA